MIKISKEDLLTAVSEGVISESQIEPLWKSLSNGPIDNSKVKKIQFNLTNVLYYFGGLLILFAMTWFFADKWVEVGGRAIFKYGLIYCLVFSIIALLLYHIMKLEIPGGLLATVAIFMVPITIYGYLRMNGLWPDGNSTIYDNYDIWVLKSWSYVYLGTLVAAITMLKFIQFPLLSLTIHPPIVLLLQVVVKFYSEKESTLIHEYQMIGVGYGLTVLIVSYLIDRRTRKDFAFWGYLAGMFFFWGTVNAMFKSSDINTLFYLFINIFFVLLSLLLDRFIFIICGGIGCVTYLGYLVLKVFSQSLPFPLVASFLGLSIIFLGVLYQKHKKIIDEKFRSFLPKYILNLSPKNRNC